MENKRKYLPEIKRIISIDSNGNLRSLDDGLLERRIMRLPIPDYAIKYELRYRQNKNGRYLATFGFGGTNMKIYERGGYVQLSCIIPDSWSGERFNRYVKVLS